MEQGILLSISIHALLAESDLVWLNNDLYVILISIHALLAESDDTSEATYRILRAFLSTLSLRRATRRSVKLFRQNYISIHALLAESDSKIDYYLQPTSISIHALLAESDRRESRQQPAGEISIHALLAESDES